MDSRGYEQGFQYSLLTFGDLEMPMVDGTHQLPAQLLMMPTTSLLPNLASTTGAQLSGHPASSVVIAEACTILPDGRGALASGNDSMGSVTALMAAATSDAMQTSTAFMAPGLMPSDSSDVLTASALMPSASSDDLPASSSNFLTGSCAAATASSGMPPPSHMFWTQTPITTHGGDSFDDSGYFSSPPASQFKAICPPATASSTESKSSAGSQLMGSQGPGSAGSQDMSVQGLSPAGSSTPRSHWAEDFSNICNMSDDWDNSFLNNFEENLFSIDASDMNSIMQGILDSPFKSPTASPLTSPRHIRQGVSPLRDSPLSSVMLSGVKVSPGGGSPFHDIFSTPSPIKGPNTHTRASPKARQRRLLLQSPTQKGSALSDTQLEMSHFLIKMEASDDLEVTPFQRTNSMGFTPTESLSASTSFEDSLAHSSQSLGFEDFMSSSQSSTATTILQEISNNSAHPRQHKKIKTERLQALHDSPTRDSSQPGCSGHKSPVHMAQRRISVTRHSHLVDKLDSKGALRFVRARFTEVLEKAVEDADRLMEARLKACDRKLQFGHGPQVPVTLPQPVDAVPSSVEGSAVGMACFTQIQRHRPAATTRRRPEILPKPTLDWPQRQLCKIVPKKRKR